MMLKPCPFCKGIAELEEWDMSLEEEANIENNNGIWYAVYCTECYAEGSAKLTPEEAVNSWNTRADLS